MESGIFFISTTESACESAKQLSLGLGGWGWGVYLDFKTNIEF